MPSRHIYLVGKETGKDGMENSEGTHRLDGTRDLQKVLELSSDGGLCVSICTLSDDATLGGSSR